MCKNSGKSARSFEALWLIFRQLIPTLPGLKCVLFVSSDGPKAAKFVRSMIELHSGWSASAYSLAVYHVTDAELRANNTETVELDVEYDIDMDMDACENLFRVTLLELGFYQITSVDVRDFLWSGL